MPRPRPHQRAHLLRVLPLLVMLPLLATLTGGVLAPAAAQPTEAAASTPAKAPGLTGSATQDASHREVRLQQATGVAAAAYTAALERAAGLDEHAASLAVRAELAAELTDQARRQAAAETDEGLLDAVQELYGQDTALDRAADAAANQRHAEQLADEALALASAADDAVEQARAELRRAERRAADVQVADAARTAIRDAIQTATFGPDYRSASTAQDRRNRAALAAWHDYLRALAEAKIVPPVASALADPEALAPPYRPLAGRGGQGIPGVAQVARFASTPLVVLPAETIRAVSEAFGRVGTRVPAAQTGIQAADCGGFVQTAWQPADVTIATDAVAQQQSLAPVARGRSQAGDLLFLGDALSGITRATIRLDGEQMIAVDPATGRVGVERVESAAVLAAARVAAPAPATTAEPIGGCGTPLSEAPTGNGLWSPPLGSFQPVLSAGYGEGGTLWSSGSHTGQDYAAPTGTPVYAVRPGVVTVENPSWAGNLVRVDHGGGVESWYAHLDTVTVDDGEEVEAGTPIGTVGDEGNSTGPHLHLELRLDGEPIDPVGVLDPATAAATTAEYRNGEVPGEALCTATGTGGLLRCDAAVALRLLDAAYQAELGEALCVSDTYRSHQSQQTLARLKPTLAAAPGTSVHGLGLAIDVCGGAESFGTAQHDFLAQHGPTFGWAQPTWARAGGSKPEPWHFEFAGAPA